MRRNKYNAKKVCSPDGEWFDSLYEYERYKKLRQLEQAGVIEQLRRQVPYELAPAVVIGGRRHPARRYIADFVYIQDGQEIVEDAKGFLTEMYRFKRHLMKWLHNIDIYETRQKRGKKCAS